LSDTQILQMSVLPFNINAIFLVVTNVGIYSYNKVGTRSFP